MQIFRQIFAIDARQRLVRWPHILQNAGNSGGGVQESASPVTGEAVIGPTFQLRGVDQVCRQNPYRGLGRFQFSVRHRPHSFIQPPSIRRLP